MAAPRSKAKTGAAAKPAAPRAAGRAPARASARPALPQDPYAFARSVSGGEFPPSLYLEGSSEPLKAECLATLRRAWREREPLAPAARVLRAAESGVEEILALYLGASLFTPRELIIVLDIEDLGRSEKRVGALAAGIAAPAGESCLVLVESAAESARKTLEPLRAACRVRVEAEPPGREALRAWGALKLQEHGVEAEPKVLELLLGACEGDAMAFFSELSRLASYAGPGGRVTPEDAAEILRPAAGAELPDYLQSVAAGDAARAGQRLGRLLAAGVSEGTILFSLSNLVGGALGGWARERAASDALRRRRGGSDLLHCLDAVYRAESAWKGGRADVVALLEHATREVCGST
jgi:DNA polymerase III delta subunit